MKSLGWTIGLLGLVVSTAAAYLLMQGTPDDASMYWVAHADSPAWAHSLSSEEREIIGKLIPDRRNRSTKWDRRLLVWGF